MRLSILWFKLIVLAAVIAVVFVMSMSSAEAVSSVEISKAILSNNPDRYIDWEVTDDVRAFVQNGVPNYGWLIKDRNEEKSGTYKTEWVSKESAVQVCGTPSAPRLVVETSAGPFEVTLPAADASLDENSPNTKRGGEPVLMTISSSPKSNWRIVVRFGLPAIPAGTTITRALLRLCLDKISGDNSTRVYEAHRLAMNWVEAEVTANQAANGVPWDFGAFESPVPLAYVNKPVLGLDPNKFVAWDVTAHVRAFLDDGVPNHGWLIKDRDENASGLYKTEWISKEGAPACGSPSAPQLVVETSAGSFPFTLPAADASLDENSPNLNRGAEPLLLGVSASPKSNWRIVVRFDLPTSLSGQTITKATLRLCLDKISGDSSRRVYEAHRLAMHWEEMEVTVNRAAVGQPWDFGAFESPVPLAYVQKDVLGIDPNKLIDWDVTLHVRAFLDDGVPNHGWLIKDRDEEASGTYKTEWISKEGAQAGSTVCGPNSAPQLVVETSAGPFTFPVPEADAWLDENSPNTNRGAEVLLLGISASPTSNGRMVVRFDLDAGAIPPNATITRALLRLCLDKISGDQSRRVYQAYRLTMHWEEMEVTTNQAAAGQPWDFGAFESPLPLAYVQKDVLTNNPDRFVNWDMTAHVRAFYENGVPNYGWLIKDRDENASGLYETEWISKEGALHGLNVCDADPEAPDSAPQLRITTTANQYSIMGPAQDAVLVSDASLDQNSPNMNRGREDLLLLRSWGPHSNWRILVRFNLDNIVIPPGEIIDRATLRLCLDKISGNQSRRVYEAYLVTEDWDEDQVTANRPKTGKWWDFGFSFKNK